MDAGVIARMMVFPVISHNPGLPDSMGDVTTTDETFNAYIAQEVVVVVNDKGLEETSSMQIYYAGADKDKIASGATISCEGVENRRIIKNQFYYKPFGVPDVGVLYLP